MSGRPVHIVKTSESSLIIAVLIRLCLWSVILLGMATSLWAQQPNVVENEAPAGIDLLIEVKAAAEAGQRAQAHADEQTQRARMRDKASRGTPNPAREEESFAQYRKLDFGAEVPDDEAMATRRAFLQHQQEAMRPATTPPALPGPTPPSGRGNKALKRLKKDQRQQEQQRRREERQNKEQLRSRKEEGRRKNAEARRAEDEARRNKEEGRQNEEDKLLERRMQKQCRGCFPSR